MKTIPEDSIFSTSLITGEERLFYGEERLLIMVKKVSDDSKNRRDVILSDSEE